MNKDNLLNVVIPCYNEEATLEITAFKLLDKINVLVSNNVVSDKSKIVFVDDGSKDKTWDIICKLHKDNPIFIGLKLSRNKGHQNALLAGLMYAKEHSDFSISMDADLQDDINVMDEMIQHYYSGSEIVYGVRNSRKKDAFFKRFTAEGFYKFMSLMGVEIVFNHADYRLMSKKALEGLESYHEVNLFLRGIVPQIGYKSSMVYYERDERVAGESKYPLKKMLSFAMDGITSFSVRPLKVISNLGLLLSFLSIVFFVYAVVMKLLGNTVEGWTFIVCSIWLVAGIQTLCLGVVGEYIGKIYSEVKARPRYIIEDIIE